MDQRAAVAVMRAVAVLLLAAGACKFPDVPLLDEDGAAIDAADAMADAEVDATVDAMPAPFLLTLGGDGDDTVWAAADASGRVALAGVAGAATTIGTTPIEAGMYVAKLRADGTVEWARGFSGAGAWPAAVALTPAGDVLVAGRLEGRVVSGALDLTAQGSDGFLFKLTSASGDVAQTRLIGGSAGTTVPERDGLTAVTSDAVGNAYVTGYFAGSGTPCGVLRTSAGQGDVFVARYNGASFNCEWDRVFGSATQDSGAAIAVDGTGVYVAADASGALNAGGSVLPAGAAGTDTVLARYLASVGAHSWSFRFDGADVEAVAACEGGVFISGLLDGTASFGGAPVGTAGADELFFVRFGAGTGAHTWSHAYAGSDAGDGARALGCAASGLVHGGMLAGGGTLGGAVLPSGGGAVAAYGLADGAHLSSSVIGGEVALAFPSPAGLVTVGTFSGTAMLGAQQRTSAGGLDVFVLRAP